MEDYPVTPASIARAREQQQRERERAAAGLDLETGKPLQAGKTGDVWTTPPVSAHTEEHRRFQR